MLNMKESQNIEWKESWRDECLKWICGFANAEGGKLIIGRDDQGELVGIANATKLMVDIPNKVRDVLVIMVDVNLHKQANKEAVEIVVEPYPSPVNYKGEYHYRSGSTKQELKGAALNKFLLRKNGLHWDSLPIPNASLADLDAKALAYFRRQALKSERLSPEVLDEPDASLLEKLHLLEDLQLKRAAILLFHPDPERFVTGAFIKIGFFESNIDLRYQDEVHGDLFAQVNQTIAILKAKYLKAWISYEGIHRVETYPVPETALREALINAVVHKDYTSGAPIQISVYHNKLMFWDSGQLPPGWTMESLLAKHSSKPNNPDIANAFFRTGMIEAWGQGIERIMGTCRVAGVPLPELQVEGSGLWVIFQYVNYNLTTEVTPQVTTQVAPQVTPQVAPQVTVEITAEERLLLILQDEMQRQEIQQRLGLKDRKHLGLYYLFPALNAGLIERVQIF